MQGQSQCTPFNSLMIHSPEKENEEHQNHSTSCVSMSSTTSVFDSDYRISSPPSSTFIDDYIGAESCLDLKSNEDISLLISKKEENGGHQSYVQRRIQRDQQWTRRREIPPPITLLARTGNLPSSRMPCVLKRFYTGDGRLILMEDKVRHHEYFQAHRSNGRLTLQLVPMDEDLVSSPQHVSDDERDNTIENQKGEIEEQCHNANDGGGGGGGEPKVESKETLDFDSGEIKSYCPDGGGDEDDHVHGNCDVAQEEVQDHKVPTIGIGGNGSAGKCLNYIRTSPSCIFGVPVPALRPVS